MRLVKYLAHAGVASRRRADAIIRAGRVTVNGERITDPARAVPDPGAAERVEVRVDGRPVQPEPTEVWMLNKPAGVVSTAHEPGPRRAVVELIDSEARLYPVGRLDVESTGLILLTNDGELANRLTHPRYEVAKLYRVRFKRAPSEGELDRLRGGVRLDDGRTAPIEIRQTGPLEVEMQLREGRNRQIRRMAEAVGNEVAALKRLRIGSLSLGRMAPGDARRLSQEEISRLWEDAEGD